MKRHLLCIVWIAAVLGMVMSCSQRSMTRFEIDYLVLETDRLVALDDLDSAAMLINELAYKHPRDTMLLLRQGVINRQLESVEGRHKSETALRRLVQMHPKNPDYHFELAQTLIAQTFEMEGRGELARTIDLDPDREEPYLILADLYRRPYFVNDYVDRGDSAIAILNALIKRKRRSVPGLTKLAEVHAVAGRLDSAEIFAQRAFQIDSTSGAANLALGYAHFQLRRYQSAADHFARAVTAMDSSARAGYVTLEYLIAPQSLSILRKLTPSQIDSVRAAFWFKEDSDPTTAVNERQIEHYARVWLANLLYSDARYELEGWKTDMGETLIRLGLPDDRRRIHIPSGDSVGSPAWMWYYTTTNYPCTLGFVDHTLSGVFSLPFARRDGFADYRVAESKQISHLIYRVQPTERWQDRELEPIEIRWNWYQFRSTPDLTDLEIYLSATCDSFDTKSLGTWEGGAIRAVLHGRDGRAVWTDSVNGQGRGAIRINGDEYVTRLSGAVPSGKYRIGATVDQVELGRFGTQVDTIVIRNFSGRRVAMSDILLAERSSGTPAGLLISRGGEQLLPVVDHEFTSRDTILVYFEIYNLALDLSGRTRYEVTYAMQFTKGSEGGLKGLVGKIFPGRRESITNTYREGGTTATVDRMLALSVSDLRPGRYRLTVTIEDLVLGGTSEQSAELLLLE